MKPRPSSDTHPSSSVDGYIIEFPDKKDIINRKYNSNSPYLEGIHHGHQGIPSPRLGHRSRGEGGEKWH